MRIPFLIAAAFCALSVMGTTLTVDPARSQITVSGTVGGGPLREQGSGSLTTTVGGNIDISVANGQIQINGANLDPNVNGSWAPGRNGQTTSPADLAGQTTVFGFPVTGALRDLLVNASSAPKSVQANGQFDAADIVFSFPTNSSSVFEYDSFVTGKGSKALAASGTNQTATVGTLVDAGGTQTLTIALDATFYFSLVQDNDTQLRLKGQIVAASGGAEPGPMIGDIHVINGQVKFTATGTTALTHVEASADLIHWSPQNAAIEAAGGTRTFTVPVSGAFQFYRLVD